jgi:DNA repair exonuclease SbcCD ATPase subunit
MQLLRLEVKNWCQHTFRSCTFTRGLVAIIGRIGSGKSNLMGAICWLLTGENPNSGVKADNVSQLGNDEEPAYAKLEFEHAGHIVVVTRHLRPEKEQATVFVDDVEKARGDKAVTAYIEQLLGIDSKFISRFVLVAQNEIFAFIEDGPSETDKFFQKLFGTANAEKCQELIGKQAGKLVIPEILVPSAQLQEQIGERDEQLVTLADEIKELPAAQEFMQSQTEQRAIIQNWDTRCSLVNDLQQVNANIAGYAEKLDTITKACDQYDNDLKALKDVISGNQESHTSAKVALNHLATYRKIAAVKDATRKRLAAIEELKASKVEPASVSESDKAAARSAALLAEYKLNEAKSFIAVFADSGVANCPTCHTPAANLADELVRVKAALPTLTESVAQAKTDVTRLAISAGQREDWEKEIHRLDAEAQQLRESTKTFSNIEAPETSEEELLQLVTNHENLQKAQTEIEPIAQKAREKKAGIEAALETLKLQAQKLSESMAAIAVDQSAADLAKAMLLVLEQQFAERQNLERQYTALKFERDNLYTQFDTAQKNEQQARKMREWLEIADTARGALKAAPKLVTKRNLQRLEVAINDLLQVFGVDFFVKASADDSSSFIAEFFDGRKQPAKRLSYGQKTVLALAFRVAVNSLFAEQIGLLALDEPTAYLDQQRIKALAPVFEKLREFSTARGLQCLLVTHEMSLAHLFESTVELDA